MKKFLFFALLIFVSCKEENPINTSNAFDDSNIPDNIKKALLYDAAYLTFSEMRQDTSVLNNQIEIPEDIKQMYYRGLVTIENMNNEYPFNKVKNIHVYSFIPLNYFLLKVDKNFNWVRNLISGKLETGEPLFDSLVTKYQLQIHNIDDFINTYVTLYSPNPLNVIALSKKFSKIKGIVWAEPDYSGGDGDDLEAVRKRDHILFIFSHGWGDCVSGCIYRHFWVIGSYYNGTVKFIEEYGDPLP